MSTIVLDCPRCGAASITMDIGADIRTGSVYGWSHAFELFVVCRRCLKPSIASVSLRRPESNDHFARSGDVSKGEADLSQFFVAHGFTNFADVNPDTTISKKSKTTYGQWCDRYGIAWGKA